MARNREAPFGHHIHILNLMFLIGSTLFWDPLLTLAQRNPHKPSISFPIYTYLCFLNPINFFLNILFLFLDVTACAGKPQASPPVLVTKYLPPAAHIASISTLFLSAPLSVLAAASEESAGLALAAGLVCLLLITVLSFVIAKLLNSRWTIITGLIFSFSSIFPFPDKISDDIDVPVNFILVCDLPLPFVSFIAFILSMILVILCIAGPSASTRAWNLVSVTLSVAIAALLVGEYLQLYVAVTDMAAVVGEHMKGAIE